VVGDLSNREEVLAGLDLATGGALRQHNSQ
jgi:hypothetical protein